MTTRSQSPQAGSSEGPLPLSGVTVIEATASLSGAYAARLMADMGATVLRVVGAGTLRRRPLTQEAFLWEKGLEHALDDGKRLAGVDLTSKDGLAGFRELLEDADLLVEDVGLVEGILPWTEVQALNPQLSVISLSAFGASGPYDAYPASDLTLWAWSGFAWMTPWMPDYITDPTREPPLAPTGVSMASIAGGTAALVAALSALAYGDGHGRRVEVSELDALVALNYHPINQYEYMRRLETRGRQFPGPNCYLPCKDGWVVLVATNQPHWEALMEIMGNPEWGTSEVFGDRQARATNWDALEPLLIEWTMAHTGREITEALQTRGLGAQWAASISEVLAYPQVAARGNLRSSSIDGREVRFPGLPFFFSDLPRPWKSTDAPDREAIARRVPAAPRGAGTDNGTSSRRSLPLEGLRVLDFGQFIAAPFCGRWLAALGADVILVESRMNPADFRGGQNGADGIPGPNRAPAFNILSQGKRSISLNLRTPQGQDIAKRLAAMSDVVIENFSTGIMDRWGLGYDDLSALNPRLVYVSVNAMGRTGPLKDYTGLHSVINAYSGMADVTGYSGGHRRLLGSFFPDSFSGTCAAWATLAALRQRERTGTGRFVDIAMAEALMTLTLEPMVALTSSGREPRREGSRHPHLAPHGIYRSRGEDQWVAIAVRTDEEWRALCHVLQRPDWAADSRYAGAAARKRHEGEIDAVIAAWTGARTKHAAAGALLQAGIPAAPCLDPQEVSIDPHLDMRGSIAPVDHPEVGSRRYPSLPWRIDGQVIPPRGPAPLLHQYTVPILRELLGISQPEVEELVQAGALT